MKNIKIEKNPEQPETPIVLADAIIKISNAMESISKIGINEKAIIILIQDACEQIGYNRSKKPVSRDTIIKVLNAMKILKGRYCRKL